MSFLIKRNGQWQSGHECLECNNLFVPSVICPRCGNKATSIGGSKGHNEVAMRKTWTQVPQWLNLIFLSMLWWDDKYEKKGEDNE